MEKAIIETPKTLILGEAYTHGSDLLRDYKRYFKFYVQSEIERIFNSLVLNIRPREVEVIEKTPKDYFSDSEEKFQAIFFQRAEACSKLELFPKDAAPRLSELFLNQKSSDGKYYVAMRPHRLKSGKEVIFYFEVIRGVHWLCCEESKYNTILKSKAKFFFCRPIPM